MNKRVIFIFVVITILCILIYWILKINSKEEENNINQNNISANNAFNEIEEETIEISVTQEKTTPNTILVLKKYYEDCQHTISNRAVIPDEMVNLTKEEIAEKYPNWELEDFSKEQIILFKTLDSFCGEHYLLTEEDGYIYIYIIDEQNNRNLKEKTDISVEYLPETDRIGLRKGIMIYGTEELNKIIEDFES